VCPFLFKGHAPTFNSLFRDHDIINLTHYTKEGAFNSLFRDHQTGWRTQAPQPRPSFNSLFRDHNRITLPLSIGSGNFQFSLSRSHITYTVIETVPFAKLSILSFEITITSGLQWLYERISAFNSLFRDHANKWEQSLRNVGFPFNSLFRDHETWNTLTLLFARFYFQFSLSRSRYYIPFLCICPVCITFNSLFRDHQAGACQGWENNCLSTFNSLFRDHEIKWGWPKVCNYSLSILSFEITYWFVDSAKMCLFVSFNSLFRDHKQ